MDSKDMALVAAKPRIMAIKLRSFMLDDDHYLPYTICPKVKLQVDENSHAFDKDTTTPTCSRCHQSLRSVTTADSNNTEIGVGAGRRCEACDTQVKKAPNLKCDKRQMFYSQLHTTTNSGKYVGAA